MSYNGKAWWFIFFILSTGLTYAISPGDLNGDYIVNINDVLVIAGCIGQDATMCQSGRADPNNDGQVNVFDFIHISRNWGNGYQPLPNVQAHQADAFVDSIGVNTHLHYNRAVYYTNFNDIIKPRLAELGVRHIRDAVLATNIWSAPTQRARIMELYNDLGVKVSFVPDINNPVNDTLAALKLTLPAIEFVEGPNEYDHRFAAGDSSWVPALQAYTQQLHSAIKNDPQTANIPVLSPSFIDSTTAAKVGDISSFLDYGNIHPYPYPNIPTTPDQVTRHIDNVKAMYSNKPYIVTESGYHTGGPSSDRPISELAQGKYIPRIYFENFNRGIERTYMYEFINEAVNQTDREMNFGMLHNDSTPKPAFIAVRNIIQLLEDPGAAFSPASISFSLTGNNSATHTTILQKRDGRFYLVIWQDVSTWNPATMTDISNIDRQVNLTLATPARIISLYKPLESATPMASVSNTASISLAVPDHPLIVEITT